MTSRQIAVALVLALILVGLGLQIAYWPQLPARMATHFGKDGNPNDWMSKSIATALNCALVLVIPTLFVAIGSLLRSLPMSVINIPNREYWFAPERREQSLQWISMAMSWFAVAIAGLIVAINHITFRANRDDESLNTTAFITALGLFLGATVWLVVTISLRFRRVPQDNVSEPVTRDQLTK